MTLPKRVVGQCLTIFWLDPRALRITSYFPEDHKDVPHGKAGLARWEEYGRVEKIEEGVVYLLQGIAKDPPGENRQQHELQYSVIPEALIERVTMWTATGMEELGGDRPREGG